MSSFQVTVDGFFLIGELIGHSRFHSLIQRDRYILSFRKSWGNSRRLSKACRKTDWDARVMLDPLGPSECKVEATWPEAGSATFPLSPFPNSHSQLAIDNCFYFLRCVVALDVDFRGRLWILDVPTDKGCSAKIIIYDLRRNDQELTRIELTDVPKKNLRALVVNAGSSDHRAYVGDPGDESIIVYSLGHQRWWKLKLQHGPDIPIVYTSDLTISRKNSILYLTGYPSHDLFSVSLDELNNEKEPFKEKIQNTTVFWLGKKLGSSSGLFFDRQDGLHYFLITEKASVRWNTRLELIAENHLVLLQTEDVPFINHYISDEQKNVWGLTNSWYPFRKQMQYSGNFTTKLRSRTVKIFNYKKKE
ncbi:uncharacterized protein LOC117176544 [Belonocnema kinseyi]|uniref:uncharacterized protein LOC117176544 n=1 Tax=Belonocnema kinseyi TaxID=2817044 RepID=UPI00143DD8DD|nr:uncharacterized protein LOC117176544 [Belonocnema kinseyi]